MRYNQPVFSLFQIPTLAMSSPRHQPVVSSRPGLAEAAKTVSNSVQCGEGFRDIRGVINCRGCGYKCTSGVEFGEHAREVGRRREVEDQREVDRSDGQRKGRPAVVEQIVQRTRRADKMTVSAVGPANQDSRVNTAVQPEQFLPARNQPTVPPPVYPNTCTVPAVTLPTHASMMTNTSRGSISMGPRAT